MIFQDRSLKTSPVQVRAFFDIRSKLSVVLADLSRSYRCNRDLLLYRRRSGHFTIALAITDITAVDDIIRAATAARSIFQESRECGTGITLVPYTPHTRNIACVYISTWKVP